MYKKVTSFISKEYVIHVLFWFLYFSAINVDWTVNWLDQSLRPLHPAPLSALAFPVFFYINANYFIPRFLNRKKWHLYVLITPAFFLSIEALRILFTYSLSETTDPFLSFVTSEIKGRDSLIFSTLSPAWFALIFSFAYRFTKDWFINKQRIERLEAEQLQKELSLIKAQINPHFWFNNLNTLDELIDTDPSLAKNYLHKMSRLYRYLITSVEKELVPLHEELDFANDYAFIIENRFGGAYRFEINRSPSNPEDLLIPPASLQTLIENVVKHNVGSLKNPLVTSIKQEGASIIVSHLKQPKQYQADSLGTGLQNLKTRYHLICNQTLSIVDDTHFTVTLPLVQQKA